MSPILSTVLRLVCWLGCLPFAASLVVYAQADGQPLTAAVRSQRFEITVTGLSAAPGYVLFVYPRPARGDPWGESRTWGKSPSPTSVIKIVQEGERIRLAERSPTPALYLMRAAAFWAWREAHPVVRDRDDEAAARKLIRGKRVVRCNAQMPTAYYVPSSRPEYDVLYQDFELLKGNGAVCRTRELRGRGPF